MDINKTEYLVADDCYIKKHSLKDKICLMSTTLPDMLHLDKLKLSEYFTLNNCPMFTITKDGQVYQHYDIDYYSKITGDNQLNKSIISIAFENLGWLSYSEQLNIFLNWSNFSVDKVNVHDQLYKDYRYWDKITLTQMTSVTELCIYLCDNQLIKKDIVTHLFKYDDGDINNYKGIFSINNILDKNTDINTSFNFKSFYKNLINKQ